MLRALHGANFPTQPAALRIPLFCDRCSLGQRQAVPQACRGKDVGRFGEFVVGLQKSTDVQEALFHQGVNDVIGAAQAEACGFGQIALAVFWVLLQHLQQAEVRFLFGGHGAHE